jgi:hypothetical protein
MAKSVLMGIYAKDRTSKIWKYAWMAAFFNGYLSGKRGSRRSKRLQIILDQISFLCYAEIPSKDD